jgi:hypothetical protein
VSICLPSIFVFVKRAITAGPKSLFNPATINETTANQTHNSSHHGSARRSWIGNPNNRGTSAGGRGGFFGRFSGKGKRGSMEPLYDTPPGQDYKAVAAYKSPSRSSQTSQDYAGNPIPIPMKSVWVKRDVSISRSQR